MRPAQQQYVFAQQQQQLQQQAQQQAALQLNAGFSPVQQQSTSLPYLAPQYSQLALNGLQVLGLPMGSAAAISGTQRGVLPLQNGYFHQQWAHLRPESQVWSSGVFPSSQQGLIQSNLVHQHVQPQQHVAYLHDLRTASVGLSGVALPQLHGGDGLLGSQQWAHSHDVQGQYGASSICQDPRRPVDGMRPTDFSSRGSSHGGGHSYGNGNSHNKPYDKNNKMSGNWSHGTGGVGSATNNPRFKGGKTEKGRRGETVRLQTLSLRCDACDRTFTTSQQVTAHNNTHIKCDVQGCSFAASGRVVKEHKQSIHDSSASDMQVRNKPLKSKDSEEELARWIEERKRNYPTTANVKHKVEEMRARKLRGELVDEDARKRRERLKEILAKQAELGVPVAEVPAYYMSDRYGSLKGKGERDENSGSRRNENHRNAKRQHDRGNVPKDIAQEEDAGPRTKVARILDGLNDSAEAALNACELDKEIRKDIETTIAVKDRPEIENVEADLNLTGQKDQKNQKKSSEKLCFFFKRGKCKKGNRCEFLHERRPKKKKDVSEQPPPKRAPTLLAKLLESDIRREKSHLLQSFRFFVNNMFLVEFPEQPLKFFAWQEGHDRNSDGEVGGPDREVQDTGKEDGTGTDEDVNPCLGELDTREVSQLGEEPRELRVETDSDGEADPW